MITLIRKLLAALAIAAIGQQLRLHISASYNVLNFFSYFTNLANLFAVFVLLLCAYTRHTNNTTHDVLRYISTVNMLIVGLVFSILLRNVDLGALLPWVNIVVHYIMPVAVVVDWLLQPPAAKLQAKHLAMALLFPALYVIYVLARGGSTGWYPYPFLNPVNVGGYAGVAVYVAGIALAFVVAGWALMVSGNRRVQA